MVTVTLGVMMFTFTIVSLVGLLMVARRQLVSTGDVTIVVNDDPDKALHTSAGSTLLGTLAQCEEGLGAARLPSRLGNRHDLLDGHEERFGLGRRLPESAVAAEVATESRQGNENLGREGHDATLASVAKLGGGRAELRQGLAAT